MSFPVFRFRRAAMLAPIALCAALAACGGGDDGDADEPSFRPLDLTIAHVNDHHSNLEPFADQEMTIGGVPTQVSLGGFARVAQAFEAYEGRTDVLKLHAGDANTGTLYYTLFKGRADAELMNTVCFDAMAVGNHEFDDGDAQLKAFIDHLHAGGCRTPVLAANVRPQVGTPLAPRAADDYVKPYAIKTVDGVRIGIVGITVKGKTQASSSPLATTVFDDEVEAAQRAIDRLKGQGIRHIVLLTHQGYEADKAMAARLSDVDAIIGGDSHSLLGDFRTLGSGYAVSGPYPTQAVNRDGKPVCIGQAWEYAKAIGEMRVSFDDRGEVRSCAGRASLLIGGEGFKRKNEAGQWTAVDEGTRQQIAAAAAADANLKLLDAEPAAAAALSRYAGQVAELKAQPIGSTAQALCLVRTPGESTNRNAGTVGCEAANMLARGSDIAQLVAQAFLDASKRADIAIQNAGGVRVPLKAGVITMNDAFTVLPFSNVLVELPLTGRQVAAVLEDAVSYLDTNPGSNGPHPYAAGLRWHLDMSKPRGERFSRIEVKDRRSGNWSAIDPEKTYVVATNDFIAKGKDGYLTFKPIWDSGNYVNSYLLYTQTFVDYLVSRGTVDRPSAADVSHQAVVTKGGVVLP